MKKRSLLCLMLSGLTLMSCEVEPVKHTEPPMPLEAPFQEDVLEALQAFAEKDVVGFTYDLRTYQWNSYTQAVYKNTEQIIGMDVYSNGVDGTLTNIELDGVTEPTEVSKDTGRFAAYNIDEATCCYGFESTDPSLETSFINYFERNRYTDVLSNVPSYEGVFSDALSMFEDVSIIYTADDGYEPVAYEVEETEQGYVARIGATAAADEVYSAEEDWMEVVLDKMDYSILEMNYGYRIYKEDFVEENIDEETATLQGVSIKDIAVGELKDGTISPLNVAEMPKENVDKMPLGTIVEDVEEGVISDEKVLQILDNISAYGVGTKSAHGEIHYANYTDSERNELGACDDTFDLTAYKNDITIQEETLVFENAEIGTIKSHTEFVAAEEGIQISTKQDDLPVSCQLIGPESINTMAEHFNPSPAYNSSVGLTINELVAAGFGKEETSYLDIERTLKTASNIGGTIIIEVENVSTYSWGGGASVTNHWEIKDGFLIKFNQKSGEGDDITYTMVKGELTEYTGELLPFTAPVVEEEW